jgi:lipopolysaccharide export system permease protein
MNRIGRYIFLEALTPLLFFVAALTAIVWLSQSLRYVSVIVDQGQSALTFLYLISLMLPSLMIFVLPGALACAIFFAIYRLQSDSELVVMSAAGISRWRVIWPLMVLALLVAGLHLAINVWLMPAGQRTLQDRMFAIRGDLVQAVLREGQFTTPGKGLTIYVRERTGTREAKGILVHDNRDPAGPVTYMAERGEVIASDQGPRFLLANGSVQRIESEGRVTLLRFATYTIDLAPFQDTERSGARRSQERYIPELLNPPDAANLTQDRIDSLRADAHERLSSPLYSFVIVLIPAAFLLTAAGGRRGMGWRVAMAAATVLVVRMAGLALRGAVAETPALWPALYVFPLLAALVCALWISGARFGTPSRAKAGAAA